MKKIRKILLIAFPSFTLALICAVAAVNLYVVSMSGPFIVRDGEAPPAASAAIVPGAAVWRGGRLSHVLEDRAITALELYRHGAVKKILATGARNSPQYDEVGAMKKFFLARGVALRDLLLDPEGFDTYSSMSRASKVFGVREALVITQKFHLHRSVYMARSMGIEARGVPADRRTYVNARYYRIREWFARVKSAADLLFGRHPNLTGDFPPVNGDGRKNRD